MSRARREGSEYHLQSFCYDSAGAQTYLPVVRQMLYHWAIMQPIEIRNSCHKHLDIKGIVGTILMDLSKAYNCIPHDLLIAKLEAYEFNRKALRLRYSYLSNRTQRVKIGSTFNLPKCTSIDVPQGSVLGPLLFNVFINDLFYRDLELEIRNYADDTTIYSCDTNIDSVIIKLERDLQELLDWCTVKGMRANPSKFQIMFIRNEK